MLKDFLLKQQENLRRKQTDFYTSSGLHIFFKDPVENVDVESVVGKVEDILPDHLRDEVEMIIVGWFDIFTIFYGS